MHALPVDVSSEAVQSGALMDLDSKALTVGAWLDFDHQQHRRGSGLQFDEISLHCLLSVCQGFQACPHQAHNIALRSLSATNLSSRSPRMPIT